MNMKYVSLIPFIFVLLMSMEAWGFEELSDLKLNAVTAGNTSVDQISADSLTRIPLHYSSKKVSVDGELIVVPLYNSYETSSLQLSDNAQSNLRSLININAVNSPIQVLLNLNINVNSNIQQIK